MEIALRIRNILLRAFALSYAAIILVWLVSLIGLYDNLLDMIYHIDSATAERMLLEWIAGWKIAAFVLFLIPAVAIHWEYVWNIANRQVHGYHEHHRNGHKH
jgi:hypothetical protein